MSLVTCHELARKFCFLRRRKFSDVVFINLFIFYKSAWLNLSTMENKWNRKPCLVQTSVICYPDVLNTTRD